MAQNNISIYDYKLFNATDIKSFIIQQLKQHGNDQNIEVFKDVNYLGSNMNTFIDTIAVILQQLLFHMSMNAAETAFSTAQLYESMNKIVSLLGYKPSGKQTSLLPVRFIITPPPTTSESKGTKQYIVPRFLQISHNSNYVLKHDIVKSYDLEQGDTTLYVEATMFQGQVSQSQIYRAVGDEFETITLSDPFIENSSQFISDNFFSVFVDETGEGDWYEYTETSLVFMNSEKERVYERRLNEDYGYEFKFGNDTYGKKLRAGSRVVIYYLVSDGESAIIGDGDVIQAETPTVYTSALYESIMESVHNTSAISENNFNVNSILVSNTGPSTAVTYPESVQSMRNNAPRVFASQNKLFTLTDYYTFIKKNFTSYCRDIYVMSNNSYTEDYIRYYYDLGIDSPNEDSRMNLAQMTFMTSCNFNNVYATILPKVHTIISDKVPNYLNTAFKQEIIERTEPYRGLTHNLVILDPIYRAYTFGSTLLDDNEWNEEQLQNKLVIVRDKHSKFSRSYIKKQVVQLFTSYFNNLGLGNMVDVSYLSSQLYNIQGVSNFYIQNINGGNDYTLTFYTWNPLYNSEDKQITQQTLQIYPFQFCYFYDLGNISELITIQDA